MFTPARCFVMALLCLVPAGARADAVDLDVSHVAVFSSGVAYFERAATVAGDATADLRFRTEQINDILKSMVVNDLDGGRIGVVRYPSRDPIERTLQSFGVDLTNKPTLGQLLDQLRGEPVEITGVKTLAGAIVGVEKTTVVDDDGNRHETELLTLLTDNGLTRLDLQGDHNIRIVDAKVRQELHKALTILATLNDADRKTVELQFHGDGQRRVRVAYMLEAPIWKTSYRLSLDEADGKPFLQGWATVENATEEDWNNVTLALVSGRPISFRMDLYTPLYVPRPLEQLELYASLRPPDYAKGMGDYDGLSDNLSGVRRDRGRMAGRPMRGVAPESAEAESSVRLYSSEDAGRRLGGVAGGLGVSSAAEGREAGELFEYRIGTPVSIPRQQSAMLPIVNEPVAGEKVSIYNPATHPVHPLNGLEFENTTGLNLMQGPVTVFEGGTYAGDAKLPNISPGEERLVAYALDLSTHVMVRQESVPRRLVSVRIAKGTLYRRDRYVDDREYVIRNESDRERTLLLEQAYSDDWKLIEPEKPYEEAPNLLRFKLAVEAKKTAKYPVKLERIIQESVTLMNVGLEQIRWFIRAKEVSDDVRAALERVVSLRVALDQLEERVKRLDSELNDVIRQQERIRDNLRVIERNTDSYRRQMKKFDEYETQIEHLRNELTTVRENVASQQQNLEQYLLSLNID